MNLFNSDKIPEDCKYRDKNGNIYGLICVIYENDIPLVYSMTSTGRFSFSMLKDIFNLYRRGSMNLVLDDDNVIKSIEPKLKRLGFILEKNNKITIARYRKE